MNCISSTIADIKKNLFEIIQCYAPSYSDYLSGVLSKIESVVTPNPKMTPSSTQSNDAAFSRDILKWTDDFKKLIEMNKNANKLMKEATDPKIDKSSNEYALKTMNVFKT